MVPEFGNVSRQISHEGKPGSFVFIFWGAVILGIVAWISISFWLAIIVSILVVIVGRFFSQKIGMPILDQPITYTTQTTHEQIREHRCCIECRKPTEILR